MSTPGVSRGFSPRASAPRAVTPPCVLSVTLITTAAAAAAAAVALPRGGVGVLASLCLRLFGEWQSSPERPSLPEGSLDWFSPGLLGLMNSCSWMPNRYYSSLSAYA